MFCFLQFTHFGGSKDESCGSAGVYSPPGETRAPRSAWPLAAHSCIGDDKAVKSSKAPRTSQAFVCGGKASYKDPRFSKNTSVSSGARICKEAIQSLLCSPCVTERSAAAAIDEAGNAHELRKGSQAPPVHCCVASAELNEQSSQPAFQEGGAIQRQHLQQTGDKRTSRVERSHRQNGEGTATSHLIVEDHRATGYAIVWYAPEDTYNPLYFGSPLEEGEGYATSLTVDTCLQYAGAAVGAVSALAALGISFLFLAAGLAVGIGTTDVVAQYNLLQAEAAEGREAQRTPR